MESIYLDFAVAWAYRTKTGVGDAELKAARDRMQSHPNYAVGRHLEALALAERVALSGTLDPKSTSAASFEQIISAVRSKTAGEIGPNDDPFGDLFAA